MKISFWQRILLGFGGGINAIKTDFFSFFLGFFYLTFLGLNPLLTGSAVLLALLFDAFQIQLLEPFLIEQKLIWEGDTLICFYRFFQFAFVM